MEDTMKVYAIFANDNTKGTTQKLFNQAIDTLKSLGQEIDILNLIIKDIARKICNLLLVQPML